MSSARSRSWKRRCACRPPGARPPGTGPLGTHDVNDAIQAAGPTVHSSPMPVGLPVERVLPLLESRDPAWAMDARAAWDWLTASGDVPEVTLRDLEYFLWYQLPAKFLTDHHEHR